MYVDKVFGGFSFVNNGRVTNYGGTLPMATGTVYTLAQDSKGTMWAGTGRGVWRFDGFALAMVRSIEQTSRLVRKGELQ
jgi:ligand-binding sensor domain-containing protein